MSFLVSLERGEYQNGALNQFAPASNYSLLNARAMMWMSQLAYDTDNESKVDSVLSAWNLRPRLLITNDPVTGLPPRSACVIVAGGRGVTVVSFAGTDPLKISDWITDFTTFPSADQVHTGFQNAVTTVWPRIRSVIENRLPNEQPLFFTGHSLGGALAIIAAERAKRELNAQATAVYTFGSPRPGGQSFADAYGSTLAGVTFRLVNGTDLVATVPPSAGGTFRHVGAAYQCPTDGLFETRTDISGRDADAPQFTSSLFTSFESDLRAAITGRVFQPVGRRSLAVAAGLLPRMVRDHVPDNYFRALSITI
jgi:hypothetical protein